MFIRAISNNILTNDKNKIPEAIKQVINDTNKIPDSIKQVINDTNKIPDSIKQVINDPNQISNVISNVIKTQEKDLISKILSIVEVFDPSKTEVVMQFWNYAKNYDTSKIQLILQNLEKLDKKDLENLIKKSGAKHEKDNLKDNLPDNIPNNLKDSVESLIKKGSNALQDSVQNNLPSGASQSMESVANLLHNSFLNKDLKDQYVQPNYPVIFGELIIKINNGDLDFILEKLADFAFIHNGLNVLDFYIDINIKYIFQHFIIGFQNFFTLIGWKKLLIEGEDFHYYAMINFLYLIFTPICFIFLKSTELVKEFCLFLLIAGFIIMIIGSLKFKYNKNIRHFGILLSSIGILIGPRISISIHVVLMLANFLFFNKYYHDKLNEEIDGNTKEDLEKTIIKRLEFIENNKRKNQRLSQISNFKYSQEILIFICSVLVGIFTIIDKEYHSKMILTILGFLILFIIIIYLLVYIMLTKPISKYSPLNLS